MGRATSDRPSHVRIRFLHVPDASATRFTMNLKVAARLDNGFNTGAGCCTKKILTNYSGSDRTSDVPGHDFGDNDRFTESV